ncbi:MAG: hypothetical protein ACP5I1_12905, partial [Candidatus Hinthialibacter sp.]
YNSWESPPRRLEYKKYMLAAAIEKATYGYQMIEDEEVTNFWKQYQKLTTRLAPELHMPPPKGKPSHSSFIYFRGIKFPEGLSLVHKVDKGKVDLQFAGMGKQLHELETQYQHRLEPGMTIAKASKSGAVRIKVPIIRMTDKFQSIETNAAQGVLAAKRLLAWYFTTAKKKDQVRKSTHRYQMIVDETVTNFWRQYYRFATLIAPELKMSPPPQKPSQASYIYFRNIPFPKGVSLVHKVDSGKVDLQFAGMGTRLDELKNKYQHDLDADMEIAQATKSGSIRICVPVICMTDEFQSIKTDVEIGIKAAKRLLAWYFTHAPHKDDLPPKEA